LPDYRVNLDIFAGPLDLLLYLVRKEEVDIYDISIAKITDQYIQYVEMLKSLDIDLAGDFLVMAATLMQIKSAMLLPKADPEMIDDDLSDPRAELIRQLLEYKKYKDASNLLGAAAAEHKQRFARPDGIIDRLTGPTEPEIDLDQISIWDLLEAFDAVCKATGAAVDFSHITDDTPIDLYQIEILHRLQTEGRMTFERLFEAGADRLVMVGMFLALLELVRARLVWTDQPASAASIYLRALTEEPAEQAVQKAILAAAEADNLNQPDHPQQHPIPIAELPPQKNQPAPLLAAAPQDHTIPIAELPSKTEQPAPDPRQKTTTEQNPNHKQKTTE